MEIHWQSRTFLEHVLLLYCIVCFFIGQNWWIWRGLDALGRQFEPRDNEEAS